VYGEIRGLDTSNFPVGTLLYPLEGVNENFYPFGLFGWVESTNANPLVCAIVTRQQQNTGRIFVRMWSPGYRDRLNRLDDVVISSPFQGALLRYDADQSEWRVPPQTSKSILEGATETVEIYYYSITTDTQQFRSAQSDTPSSGNKIVRKIWYSTTAQDDIDSGTWTLLETLDDNATYADLVDAFEDQLKTSPGGDTPVSIKTTWEDVPAFTGLLDQYPGAAAAYSLRRLTGTYTGAAIRVRRDSDDAEQDIGFDSNGDLDTTALATFCSGTDGFVKVWYCQSGNGNDATQATTGSQPKIYDSVNGVIEEGGAGNEKPALDFDGTNDGLNCATNLRTATGASTVITICNLPQRGDVQNLFAFYKVQRHLIEENGNTNYNNISVSTNETTNEFIKFIGADMSSQVLNFATWDGSSQFSGIDDIKLAQNGTLQTQTLGGGGAAFGTTASGTNSIGYRHDANAQFCDGTIQEVIVYLSDQDDAGNRSGIETNINDHYGIYTPFTTGLLDDYSGAAAAYSLRRLSSTYTGPAIRVRRASDNAEQDIEFDIEGNLNTGALAGFCSGTDGFVKIWYDQAGSNDAEQTTAANQPKIYDSITGVIEDGSAGNEKPSLSYGANARLKSNFTALTQPSQVFAVANKDGQTNAYIFDSYDDTNRTYYGVFSSTHQLSAGTDYTVTSAISGVNLHNVLINTTSSVLKINSSTIGTSGDAGTNSLGGITIGNRFGVFDIHLSKVQEFILYNANKSTSGEESGIETNINDYYLIYTP